MLAQIMRSAARLMCIVLREEGQDIVEYALIVACIALAATAGMNSLASAINNEFSSLGTMISNGL